VADIALSFRKRLAASNLIDLSCHCHHGCACHAWAVPNTSNIIDRALEGILLGQQPLDAAPASSEIAIPIKLNVARWHRDGRTLWRSRTTFDLEA